MDAEQRELPREAPAPPAVAGERGGKAREFLAALLGHLGVTAEVQAFEAGDTVTLRTKATAGAEAIGLADAKAPLWEPIAYLVGKMMNQDPAQRCLVAIDTGVLVSGGAAQSGPSAPPAPLGEEPDEELMKLGRFLTERAKQVGKVLVVGPMGSRERKAIHLAVKELGGATSRSEGDGAARRVLIVPDKLAPPPTQPEGV